MRETSANTESSAQENEAPHRSHWPLSILGGAVSLLNLFLPLILVRILTPEDVGKYKIFFLYLVLVPWFCLTAGINNGLSHWAGYAETREKAFRSSWTILLLISLLALACGFSAQNSLAQWLEWTPKQMHLFLWGALVTILANFFDDATIAMGWIWRGAFFTSGFELARGAAILTAALAFRSIDSVFIAHIAMMSLKLIVGASWGFKIGFQRPTWDPKFIRSVVRYALPVSLSAALSIVSGYSDQIVLSKRLSPTDFANYSLGCLLVPPLLIFEQSVNKVLIPRMAAAFAAGRSRWAMILFRDAVSELSWILIPAAIGMIIFAEPIIVLLFTAKFLPAAFFLRIFAINHLANLLPNDAVARAHGNGKWILNQLIVFSIISMVSVYFAVLKFGATGALVDLTFIGFAMRWSAAAYNRKAEGWPFREMLPWGDWLRYIFWASVAGGAGWIVRTLTGEGLNWFLVGGTLFSLIYGLGTLSTFLRRRANSCERPQILILSQHLGIGGLERMILNLGRGLLKNGRWQPMVVVYDYTPENPAPTLHDQFERSGIQVVNFIKGSGISLRIVRNIATIVVKRRVALIHSHDLGALIYAVLTKIVTLGAIKVVHTQHSFIHLEKSPRYKHYERFFSFFADHITTVSESLRTQYPSVGIQSDAVEVIPNGMEYPESPVLEASALDALRESLTEQSPELNAKPRLLKMKDRVWVLCMARVHPKKGQDQVLKLWEQIPRETRAKATLILVGPETYPHELSKLWANIGKLGDSSDVIYAGYTHRPKDWLLAADIFISGSEFEGMPLGPIEAIGSGLKTIISDIPGHSMLPSYAERFSLNDKAEGARKLAEHIEEVARNSSQTRSKHWDLGEEARKSWGIAGMTARYESIYLN